MAKDYLTIKLDSPDYPKLLKEISKPPAEIFIKGALPKESPALAIVGTRRPTAYGLEAARQLAADLAGRGFLIVSGLAFGIDAAAHEATLKAGGKTIAVLPCGIEHIAPTSHENLAKEIVKKNGVLVSEFKPDFKARPESFPQRNRIISGLSLGVIVIEAPEKSGSLITARHAAEQNRDVFVVPGPIFSKNYEGSHRLIQEGAKLIRNAEDVVEEYEGLINFASAKNSMELLLDENQSAIKNILEEAGEALSRDEIAARTKLEANKLQAALTQLELKKILKRLNDDTFQIASN